jgi:hypothetical protein
VRRRRRRAQDAMVLLTFEPGRTGWRRRGDNDRRGRGPLCGDVDRPRASSDSSGDRDRRTSDLRLRGRPPEREAREGAAGLVASGRRDPGRLPERDSAFGANAGICGSPRRAFGEDDRVAVLVRPCDRLDTQVGSNRWAMPSLSCFLSAAHWGTRGSTSAELRHTFIAEMLAKIQTRTCRSTWHEVR